jgi:hypothetical protein
MAGSPNMHISRLSCSIRLSVQTPVGVDVPSRLDHTSSKLARYNFKQRFSAGEFLPGGQHRFAARVFMADRARNQHGLGKAVTFNVITPMTRLGTWVVGILLWFFTRFPSTQITAKALAFLPFVHWVIVKRDRFPHLSDSQPTEKLHYDYLFFLSTFNGPWGPYIEAFADVLYFPLDGVWFWSIGYPFARPVGPLKTYIRRNQIESDHSYSAYPGASVHDVRAAVEMHCQVAALADNAPDLSPGQFAIEFDRLLIGVQNKLGTFHPLP